VPTIPYSAANYDKNRFPNVKTAGTLTFTWPRLVWAAVTVGKAEEHQASNGIFSAYERSMRTALLYSSLMESSSGQIIKAPTYEALDPSEKTAVSFYIGMTLVRLFTYSLFNVDWLLHLDLYRKTVKAQLNTKSRPDFIGVNANDDWLVFESKGRSDYMQGKGMSTLMTKAKTQASLLQRINGVVPIGSFGAITHFQDDGLLRFDMDDPPPDKQNPHAYELTFSTDQLITDYYRPFLERKDSRAIGIKGHRIIGRDLGELDVTVGLDERVLAQPAKAGLLRVPQREVGNEFLGRDGIFVRLGSNWSADNMKRPPMQRRADG
jgi:hypothetical protein